MSCSEVYKRTQGMGTKMANFILQQCDHIMNLPVQQNRRRNGRLRKEEEEGEFSQAPSQPDH